MRIRSARLMVTVAVIGAVGGWAAQGERPAAAASAPPVYQWTEAHQNAQLTGASADPAISTTNASTLGVRWMTYTGGEILGSPVVGWNKALAKTLVYVGNDAGYLMAFDQATGIPVWSLNLGSAVRNVPLIDGSSLWA